MAFLDRFIPLPITTYDNDKFQLGINIDEISIDSIVKIDFTQIVAYSKAVPYPLEVEVENQIATVVYLKSGESFLVSLSIDKFEKKLLDFIDKYNS